MMQESFLARSRMMFFLNQQDFVPHIGHPHSQGILLLEINRFGVFLGIADDGHRKPHAAGGFLHNVPVVELHPQLPGELLGNHTAHGTELPGNGDNILLHGVTSCRLTGTAFFRICKLRTMQERVKLMMKYTAQAKPNSTNTSDTFTVLSPL